VLAEHNRVKQIQRGKLPHRVIKGRRQEGEGVGLNIGENSNGKSFLQLARGHPGRNRKKGLARRREGRGKEGLNWDFLS